LADLRITERQGGIDPLFEGLCRCSHIRENFSLKFNKRKRICNE
jgi:hypothetical protein